jgi:hypothetical protein
MFYDYSFMNVVIAILSPGAMGSAISVRLVEHGARVLTSLDGRSAATVERARAAGMEDVSPETIAAADLVLSIVPPGKAARPINPSPDVARYSSLPRRARDRPPGQRPCCTALPGARMAKVRALA